jgi:tetratricopeptide (TPR) repeat protein
MLLRLACLERQRVELESLVGLLEDADPKVVELAVQATGALPQPAECDDVRALETIAKPPADPSQRADIERLRLELASSVAVANAGRPQDGVARLERVVARAKGIGYRPLEAESQFALGVARVAQGDYVHAAEAYQAAAFAAEAGGMDGLAGRACARAAVTSAATGKLSDANALLQRVAALAERRGAADKRLHAEADVARGNVAGFAGDDAQSLHYLEAGVRDYVDLLGPDHLETLIARVNLGAFYDELADAPHAIEQDTAAIAGYERVLGADHPRLTLVSANLALVRMRIGQLSDAEQVLDRALRLSRAYGPTSRRTASVVSTMSRLRLLQGRVDDAVTLAQQAATAFAASSGDKSDDYAGALGREGAALLARGDAAGAFDRLGRDVALREAASADNPAIAEDLTILVEAELALGRTKEALVHAERGLVLAAKRPRYPGELARTRFAAARALVATHGDRTRALELAHQARDELAPLAYRAALLAQVDAFLRQSVTER